jgi:hypothetical protein
MYSLKEVEDRLSKKQGNQMMARAFLIAVTVFASLTLFGVFVWTPVVLDRSHTRWHLVDGTAGKPGLIASGEKPFEAFRKTPVHYADWAGRAKTQVVKLPPATQAGDPVEVCVRRTGQIYVRGSYGRSRRDPCRPAQAETGLGFAFIGVILGVVAFILSWWLIGNAIVAGIHPWRRFRVWLAECWLARKLRTLRWHGKVRWQTGFGYRMLHGRRITPDLADAERTLATLLGMKPTPEIVSLRQKSRELVVHLEKKRSVHQTRTEELDERVTRLQERLDAEREVDQTLRQQASEELAEHDA